jgi:N utilization substance protein B
MKARHAAREAALQILYLCDVGGEGPDVALEAFFAVHQPEADSEVREFAAVLVRGTSGERAGLDVLISTHSTNWRIERLAVIDRLILRMAAWELQHQPDTPQAVVINEAIELARAFGTDESPKFVNGVLDSIRKALGS